MKFQNNALDIKEVIWNLKKKLELHELIKQRYVMNYVKAQRLSWFGNRNRMPENYTVKKIHK